MSSSVLRSTSKNSSSGFCAFLTADVDAAAADSDAAAADEKSRLPSALDRDSITAAALAASCSTTDRIRESGHGKSLIRGVCVERGRRRVRYRRRQRRRVIR